MYVVVVQKDEYQDVLAIGYQMVKVMVDVQETHKHYVAQGKATLPALRQKKMF